MVFAKRAHEKVLSVGKQIPDALCLSGLHYTVASVVTGFLAGRIRREPYPALFVHANAGEHSFQLVSRGCRWASHSSTTPRATMGSDSTWPMLIQSNATNPRWASGSRKNSTLNRNRP